jgi:hypothetical protein
MKKAKYEAEGHSGLVHGDYIVQSRQGMLPEELKEVLTPLDSLLFLRCGEEFGHTTSGLLYDPRSMVRADCTVAKVRSNMEASSRAVRRQFFSTAAATVATTSSVRLVFFAGPRSISPPSQLLLCGLSGFSTRPCPCRQRQPMV